MTLHHRVDVAVVGGGLAGLSAAIRCRWVKGHGAVPLSTVVIEPGVLGGLAAWRGCFVTGPGFYLRHEDLVAKLVSDLERFAIPHLADRVEHLQRAEAETPEARWRLALAGGDTVEADAVILATGLRRQGADARHFGRGVYLTYMGYEHLARLFARIPRSRGTALPIAVVGNRHTQLLDPLFRHVSASEGARWHFLLEPPALELELGGDVSWGSYLDCTPEAGGMALQWLDPAGDIRSDRFAAVLVDYNAFELEPGPGPDGRIPRDPRGFVRVDADGRTGEPFLYAAGDVTGGLAMALNALQQGAAAGFAAYEDLYRQRFSESPVLFAYRPTAVPVTPDFRSLPVWQDADRIVALVNLSQATSLAGAARPAAWPNFDGPELFAGLVARSGSREEAIRRLDDWLERKWVTVRRDPAVVAGEGAAHVSSD